MHASCSPTSEQAHSVKILTSILAKQIHYFLILLGINWSRFLHKVTKYDFYEQN